MDKLKDWLQVVVGGLVSHPDQIDIKVTEDEQGVLFFLTVDKEDVGKIIGRGGYIAKALRTILNSAGYLQDVRASLKIDSGFKSI